MSKITSLIPQKMWICVAEERYYHYDTLDHTRGGSIDKCVRNAQHGVQIGFEWQDLKAWGFKCIKVTVNIEKI